jgi:magnesium-transporting ATPase (P-type)
MAIDKALAWRWIIDLRHRFQLDMLTFIHLNFLSLFIRVTIEKTKNRYG